MNDNGFLDLHGQQVHAFALQIANLGFERMTTELLAMLDSGAWQEFKDGLGRYRFLPGEFDYFLSQQGVTREYVMNGVRDLDAKARIEEHMDERRTAEEGYRRRIIEARDANPQRPGRPIEPFGYTAAEVKALLNGSAASGGKIKQREPLGRRVRRFRNTGRETTKTDLEQHPLSRAERFIRSARHLSDEDLAAVLEELRHEQRRRAPVREPRRTGNIE
jgi:hypothetical protein